MARLLLLALIGIAVWLLYKVLTKSMSGSRNAQSRAAAQPSPEDMVACRRCGVNLPKSEAREVDGAFECADSASCVHRG